MRTRTATYEPDLGVLVCAAFLLTASMAVAWILVRSPLPPAYPPFEVPALQAVHLTMRSSFGASVDLDIDLRDAAWWIVGEERSRDLPGRLGAVKRRVERRLSLDEWDVVRSGFEAVDFWRLPALPEGGIDGGMMIIEGTSPVETVRVARWCSQELWPLGDLLLRLAYFDPDWTGDPTYCRVRLISRA